MRLQLRPPIYAFSPRCQARKRAEGQAILNGVCAANMACFDDKESGRHRRGVMQLGKMNRGGTMRTLADIAAYVMVLAAMPLAAVAANMRGVTA